MALIKIFTQPNCPLCVQAKELGDALKKEGYKVEIHDISQIEGLSESLLFDVMSTPTIVISDNEMEITSWRSHVPSFKEVKKYLK